MAGGSIVRRSTPGSVPPREPTRSTRLPRGCISSCSAAHRAARRDMWNLLSRAASTEPLRASLHAAAGEYTRSICELLLRRGTSRTQVGNRRVVVVPRVMIAGRARTAVTPMVGKSISLSQIDDALLAFFLDEVIVQLDHAVQRAVRRPRAPSVRRTSGPASESIPGTSGSIPIGPGRAGSATSSSMSGPRRGYPAANAIRN